MWFVRVRGESWMQRGESLSFSFPDLGFESAEATDAEGAGGKAEAGAAREVLAWDSLGRFQFLSPVWEAASPDDSRQIWARQ